VLSPVTVCLLGTTWNSLSHETCAVDTLCWHHNACFQMKTTFSARPFILSLNTLPLTLVLRSSNNLVMLLCGQTSARESRVFVQGTADVPPGAQPCRAFLSCRSRGISNLETIVTKSKLKRAMSQLKRELVDYIL
jgi:hypothetical protein